MSHRLEQLASAIDAALRQVLARGLQDPRISGLITITHVRVLPDLSEASVGVSVLPDDRTELVVHGLQAAATHLRREVGSLVQTRTIPPLRFRADQQYKRQAALLHDIDRARDDLARRESARTEPPEAGP